MRPGPVDPAYPGARGSQNERSPLLLRHRLPGPGPPLFSFNSPQGMCPGCNGIGSRLTMDPDKLVPDKRLTIHEGAVVPWRNYFTNEGTAKNSWGGRQIEGLHRKWGLSYDTPWNKMPKKHRDLVLHGSNGQGNGGLLGFGENPGAV
jgi:excinuclease UvrABC ATPase subunit